ncbi:MAG: VWA domain-containing protein [Deltaproteobacteria bacterium]|nr:VWA domain-containing protein [Deltaproteobacteria bacterium]
MLAQERALTMVEPTLSYLFAHLETAGVTVRQPWLLLLLLLVPVLLVRGRRVPRAATALRIAAFSLLVLALAGLALTARLPSERLSVVAAVDVSASIDEQGRQWAARYLSELAAALAPSDELAVVAFAREAEVVRPPAPPSPVEGLPRVLAAPATDIERGLDAGLALLAPDAERRVILLSDGLESRGDSSRAIARARRSGVRVFAAAPPQALHRDVALLRLLVPPVVSEAAIVPLRLIARNQAAAGPAQLTLFADGQPLGSERVTLQTGLNAIEIPYRISGAGAHQLAAELSAPDDDITANNRRETSLMVLGKTRVLLITSAPHSPLAAVLERKGMVVEVRTPERLPERLDELLAYQCVIMQDTAAARLDAKRLALWERYVRDFGGGLVVIGGERTFGDAGFKRTALESLLPVSLEPRRPQRSEREPLGLFVLIDRSNSMGYNSRARNLRDGEKLRYAREAALAVIQQLKDQDLVGVIAFDSQPFELAPLRRLRENRKRLADTIPRLAEGGGTDFYDALESARAQLAATAVGTRHVILLTDGDTNRAAADHYPLIAALGQAAISVTTIRIGADTVNLTLLHDISAQTGGQFYHVQDAETLPELMLRDTSQRLVQAPRQEQQFLAQLGSPSQLLRGLEPQQMPPLSGYAYSRIKPGAEAVLAVTARDRTDPLLAVWQYGLGRVVAFTAGLGDDAETWVGWPGFGKLWSQVVHWTARDETPWDYAAAVHRRDGQLELVVRTFDGSFDGSLWARLHLSEEQTVDLALAASEPREFAARLPGLAAGRYALTIVKRRSERDVNQRTVVVTVPGEDEQVPEERFAPNADTALLARLSASTGGQLNAPVRELVARHAGTRQLARGLDDVLVPLVMALFLGDVAVRRLTRRVAE